MKYLAYICVCMLALASCLSIDLDVPACKSSTLTINANVPSSTIPINQVGTIIDLSEIVAKLDDYGDVTVAISSNILSGNLSWAKHVTVTMQSVKFTDKYPEIILVDQDIDRNSSENSLRSLLSDEELTKYFAQGEVRLTFIFDKSPGEVSSFSHNICIGFSASVEKNFL